MKLGTGSNCSVSCWRVCYVFNDALSWRVSCCDARRRILSNVCNEAHFPAAGYVVGWMSWLNWSATIGIELIAVSILMKRWFPDVPSWIWCVAFAVLLFAINALSSRSFAEVEFWFASIKVITIIAFIILGGAAMFGFLDMKGNEPAPMFSSFTDYGDCFRMDYQPF